MSMDEILASIRSYVAEGQNLPKSTTETSAIQAEALPSARVIELTEEIIPIQAVNTHPEPTKFSPLIVGQESATAKSQSFENPFNRLQQEIKTSTPASSNLSIDDLLNKLATPLIQNWIDQNLRKVVEAIVEKEIEKIRRS